MTKSLTRERARSVVATPQQKLKDAQRLQKAVATLVYEAQSLGTMTERDRERLLFLFRQSHDICAALVIIRIRINMHQSTLRAKVRTLEEMVRLSNESALQSAGRIRDLEQRLTDDEVIEVCVNLEMGKALSPEHRKSGREVITAVRAIRARGKS